MDPKEATMAKQNNVILLAVAGLAGVAGYMLWKQNRQTTAPNDNDVQQSAKKTEQQAIELASQTVALDKQANNTAEMAARNAYQKAQAQLAFDQAAAGAARYAAGGIAYPQFAPSYGTDTLITGRSTRGMQLGVI